MTKDQRGIYVGEIEALVCCITTDAVGRTSNIDGTRLWLVHIHVQRYINEDTQVNDGKISVSRLTEPRLLEIY